MRKVIVGLCLLALATFVGVVGYKLGHWLGEHDIDRETASQSHL